MTFQARYVFKPNPGADLEVVMAAMSRGASLWKKHGATQVRLWIVAAGEVGDYVLELGFDSASQYAQVTDPLSADPEFRGWQADNVKAGAFSWVRSNLLRELPLA